MLGPRLDRFKDGKNQAINGHSTPLVTLGGFILVVGFMAFNGGSQGGISQPGDGDAVSSAILSTFVACVTGGTTVLFVNKFFGSKTWSLAKIVNGCLAGNKSTKADSFTIFFNLLFLIGMVSVCAGCERRMQPSTTTRAPRWITPSTGRVARRSSNGALGRRRPAAAAPRRRAARWPPRPKNADCSAAARRRRAAVAIRSRPRGLKTSGTLS